MKVAAAAYPLDWFDDWSAYEAKITRWVKDAADNGANLLVFPEYAAMELSTLDGADVAGDLEQSLHAVSRRMPDVDALHLKLAAEFGVHILGASAPVFDGGTRPVNRATLYAPNGQKGFQDKQIMTMFERDPWDVTGGCPLKVFDTELGKIGILICYDSEFPLLGRALADVDILLVPPVRRRLLDIGGCASEPWHARLKTSAFPSCPLSLAQRNGQRQLTRILAWGASLVLRTRAFRRPVCWLKDS